MSDPDDVGGKRAGDTDREAVAAVLHEAMAAGRLDLAEVDERLAATYAARTYGELDTVVADLPDVTLPWRPAVDRRPVTSDEKPLKLTAGWSNEKRTGVWRVPRRIVAETSASDVKLDFREAECPHALVDIEMRGAMGSLVLIVPEGWSVDVDDLDGAWGTVKNKHGAPAGPGCPTIVVTGKTGMGTFKTRAPYFYE